MTCVGCENNMFLIFFWSQGHTHTHLKRKHPQKHLHIHTYRQSTNEKYNSRQLVICLFVLVRLAHTASASLELPLMGFQSWDSFGAYFFNSVSFFFCTIMRSISCRSSSCSSQLAPKFGRSCSTLLPSQQTNEWIFQLSFLFKKISHPALVIMVPFFRLSQVFSWNWKDACWRVPHSHTTHTLLVHYSHQNPR